MKSRYFYQNWKNSRKRLIRLKLEVILISKNVLVTGGCGFIGSHIVDMLIKNDFFVTVVDDLSANSDISYIKTYIEKEKADFHKISIQNYENLLNLDSSYNSIFHLAAQPDVNYSVNNPRIDFETNVIGTFNILEFMRKKDISDLIFASSVGTVYGEPDVHPTPEYYPLKPISNYGAAKAAAEMYFSSYSSLYGLNITSLRLGNVYGPRSTHGVIYDFYHKLQKNPKELEILGDGTQAKSYLYIDDAIEAFALTHQKMQKGFEVYNVSSDETTTVLKVAEELVRILGLSDVNYSFTGGKRGWKGDVTFTSVDIKKLKKLGWNPSTSISEGISKYVQWLKNQ